MRQLDNFAGARPAPGPTARANMLAQVSQEIQDSTALRQHLSHVRFVNAMRLEKQLPDAMFRDLEREELDLLRSMPHWQLLEVGEQRGTFEECEAALQAVLFSGDAPTQQQPGQQQTINLHYVLLSLAELLQARLFSKLPGLVYLLPGQRPRGMDRSGWFVMRLVTAAPRVPAATALTDEAEWDAAERSEPDGKDGGVPLPADPGGDSDSGSDHDGLARSELRELVERLRSEFGLPRFGSAVPYMAESKLLLLIKNFDRALRAVERLAAVRIAAVPMPTAPDEPPGAMRALWDYTSAQAVLKRGAKGYYHQPVDAAVGPARTVWDVLHAVSTLAGRALNHLALCIAMRFEADGSLKTAERRAEYRPPNSTQRNVAKAWAKGGFSVPDFLQSLRQRFRAQFGKVGYTLEMPVTGFDATVGKALVAQNGLWQPLLWKDLAPGLEELRRSGTEAEQRMPEDFRQQWSALAVVLKVARHPRGHLHLDVLCSYIAHLHAAMRRISDGLAPYAVAQYEHKVFWHMRSDMRSGPLITHACYVTESLNSEAKMVDARHTSRGGGHQAKNGDATHCDACVQALGHMVVLHGGVMERVMSKFGVRVPWLQEKIAAVIAD